MSGTAAGSDMLEDRALGRATLARQHLLERAAGVDATAMVDRLVGMQAQLPHDPYLGLWSRIDAFDPDDLAGALERREVVRLVLMRGTIHLVTADDALGIRPLVQPILDAELRNHQEHKAAIAATDAGPVLDLARELLAEPTPAARLRDAIAAQLPGVDPKAMAQVCRNRLALVQAPPRGLWGRRAGITLVTAEAWLGRPLQAQPSIDRVVLRYLAAYGPSTVADVASWSGLTGMREVVERLRPELLVLRNTKGQEVFDLPGAPRPDADVEAPVRFLPTFDNLLIAHADRSRFFRDRHPAPFWDQRGLEGSVLHDGAAVAAWGWAGDGADRVLEVRSVVPLPKRAITAIEREGRAVARFLAAEPADPRVRVVVQP